MSTAPYLAQLRANRDETLLLAAVHGGVFAEGVDYPGDMAIGIFVVGPGLPRPSPELERIREYHEGRTGRGFEYTYAFPGLNRVVQAGGRALRTPHDRAFVMLVGRRFSEPLYREPLPEWWLAELREVEDPLPELQAFWKQGPD